MPFGEVGTARVLSLKYRTGRAPARTAQRSDAACDPRNQWAGPGAWQPSTLTNCWRRAPTRAVVGGQRPQKRIDAGRLAVAWPSAALVQPASVPDRTRANPQ